MILPFPGSAWYLYPGSAWYLYAPPKRLTKLFINFLASETVLEKIKCRILANILHTFYTLCRIEEVSPLTFLLWS